jgi:hypothetical protein
MKKVTLQFSSLHYLAECLFQLGISRPEIDYEKFRITAELTDQQIEHAKDCHGQVISEQTDPTIIE